MASGEEYKLVLKALRHDLLNPLSGMVWNIQHLTNGGQGQLFEISHELEEAARGAAAMLETVNDWLRFEDAQDLQCTDADIVPRLRAWQPGLEPVIAAGEAICSFDANAMRIAIDALVGFLDGDISCEISVLDAEILASFPIFTAESGRSRRLSELLSTSGDLTRVHELDVRDLGVLTAQKIIEAHGGALDVSVAPLRLQMKLPVLQRVL